MAGWVDGDNQTERRRNREWILGRLAAPVYDISTGGFSTAVPMAANGDVTMAGTVHFTNAATAGARALVWITVANVEQTASRNAQVFLIPSGSGGTYGNRILSDRIFTGQSLALGPFVLLAGGAVGSISADAGAAGQLAIRIDALELDVAPPGLSLIGNPITVPATTWTGLYQCPAAGIEHAIVSVTLCNADSLARRVMLSVGAAATFAATAQRIIDTVLQPGETIQAEWLAVGPNGLVAAWVGVGGVVGTYVSVVEFLIS